MNKAIAMVMLAFLSCLPMPIAMSVQAQTTQDRKPEADRLIQQGIQLYRTSRYQEAIPVLESALGIYREIKDRKGEATSLLGLGEQYRNLKRVRPYYDTKVMENYIKVCQPS